MSAFILWWTIGSSFCSIVAAIVARGAFGTGSTQLIHTAFIVYWILLGLVQWKILTPYISNAYVWGLVTIVGGIVSSFLLAVGCFLAFGFIIRNSSLFHNSSNGGDFLISLIIVIVFLFGSGFLLGWMQKLVLQNSIPINPNYIAWISSYIWLFTTPLLAIVYFLLAKYYPGFYILLVTTISIVANLVEASVIKQILSEYGLLLDDALSIKMIARFFALLTIALIFTYPVRYKILEKIGFTEVLHTAIVKGEIDAQKYLDGGGNPNGLSTYGSSLLHSATRKGNLPLMKLLIDRGTDINIKGNRQETPLHKAKDKSTAELLLTNGAEVNARNQEGNTPLHSMWRLDLDVVEVLLKYGADPNVAGFDGRTPLYYVRNSEQAKLLLENGANPNVKDKDRYKYSPLEIILRAEKIEISEKIEIAKALIDYGADVNLKNTIGNTLLHKTYDRAIGKLLIENGADVNARNNQGKTPLHYAIRREENAKLLIENGADVNTKDNEGKTPIDYAEKQKIIELLIENGAEVDAK